MAMPPDYLAVSCTRPDPHQSWPLLCPLPSTGIIQEVPKAPSLHKPVSPDLIPMHRPAPSPWAPWVRDGTETKKTVFIVQFSHQASTEAAGLGLQEKQSIWGAPCGQPNVPRGPLEVKASL